MALLLCVVGAGCRVQVAPRPWVRHLVLRGARHVDNADLRLALVTVQTSRIPTSPKGYFDAAAFALDLPRIERYYQAHGYFDARIVASTVRPVPHHANMLDVEIDIDEGPATKIRIAQVKGIDGIGDAAQTIFSNFDLKRGQIFDHPRYLTERAEVQGRMRNLGYPWAEVTGDVQVDRDHHLADVTLSANSGPRALVGKVTVEGSSRLPPRLLIRHAQLDRARTLTSDLLEDAHAKLYNLGLFSSVTLDYVHDPFDPSRANVIIRVTEAPFHEWRIGAGLSLDLQRTELSARVIYEQHQLFGGLRTLRLRLEPAYVALPAFWNPVRQGPAATAELQFSQLDLVRAPDELKTTVGYDLGVEYAFQYHGPRLQFAYSRKFWRDHVQLGISYNLNYFLFFNVDPSLEANRQQAEKYFGYLNPYRVGWFYEEAALDLRDHPFDTREGGYFSLRTEEGGSYAGGAFTYEKLVGEARGYAPIGRRIVVAARTEVGKIYVQGDTGSPITRRFFLGGPDSHRGFNYDRLSPQIPSSEKGSPALPIGGDGMFLTQIEVRIKAARLFGYWLQFAGFFDAGDVSSPTGLRGDSLSLARLHYAAGGWVGYQSVLGTIRADVGVRLNRTGESSDGLPNPDPGQRVAFHISIGEPF